MNLARTVSASLVLCTGLVLGAVVLAGDLAPPPGPIGPTLKTLAKVEPRIAINEENTPGDANSVFRIAAPGSYTMTGNVSVPAGATGIEVAASDVTIDMAGFTIVGQTTAGTLGISHDPGAGALQRLRVYDGAVRATGIGLSLGDVADVRLERVWAVSNQSAGIIVGDRAVIVHCDAHANPGGGILVGDDALLLECRAIDTTEFHGISVGSGSRVIGCTAIGTVSVPSIYSGIFARPATANGLIENCFVVGNDQGIVVGGSGWTVTGNIARANTDAPYFILPGNHPGAIVSDPALAGPWDNISN